MTERQKVLLHAASSLFNHFEWFEAFGQQSIALSNHFKWFEKQRDAVLISYVKVSKMLVQDPIIALVALYTQSECIANGTEIMPLCTDYLEVSFPDRSCWISKAYDTADFLEDVVYWMKYVKFLDTEIAQFKMQHKMAQVVQLYEPYAGHCLFGETEDDYFLIEYGCGYD